MISISLFRGDRLSLKQTLGFLLAIAGLVGLLFPGLTSPPLGAALIMVVAGIGWGIYSLRGSGTGDATNKTAGNFLRACAFSLLLLLSLIFIKDLQLDIDGVILAIVSGSIASGLGYAIWYTALPLLKPTTAATVQLSVPVIAAIAGIIFLAEPLTLNFIIASLAILCGIALVIVYSQNAKT